jgi:hypothetical protein
MTETQNPHRRPLAPGEIRTHEVAGEIFQVMHTGNGAFTQATRNSDHAGRGVIKTSSQDQDAVDAYADAIEQAESDQIDGDEDPDASGSLVAPGTLHPTTSYAARTQMLGRVQRDTPAPTLTDDLTTVLLALREDSPTVRSVSDALYALDRISAMVPSVATNRDATVSAVAALLARKDSGVSTATGLAIMELLRSDAS